MPLEQRHKFDFAECIPTVGSREQLILTCKKHKKKPENLTKRQKRSKNGRKNY